MEEDIEVSYWQGTQSEFEGLKKTDKLKDGRIYFAFGEDGYGTIYLGVSINTYKEIGCGTQKEIEKIKARLTADEVAIDANATSIIRILEMLNKKADRTELPTLTSQLTNDSRFVTEDKLEDYLLKKDHIPYDDIIALFT